MVFAPSLDDVLLRVLGLIAAARGRPDEARGLLAEALEVVEHAGARAVEARIHLDLGRVLRSQDLAAEAQPHFARAFRLADSLRMEALRAAASALGGEGEASRVAHAVEALPADEGRLLHGLVQGIGEAELSRELLLMPGGLARVRARAFARIGASTELEAAAWAHREGLASPGPRPLRFSTAELRDRAPPVRPPTGRRLTVFVSDISNSTELLQRLGDEGAQALVQDHNRLVRTLLHRHQGVELQQTGDGFIAVFDDAARALRCAVGLQREIQTRRLGGPSGLRVRVALHAGEVLLEEGRVFGVVMHTAAHICSSGRAGEILVSQPAWDSLADPSEWVAEDLGPISLKGLFEPVSLRHVEWRVK